MLFFSLHLFTYLFIRCRLCCFASCYCVSSVRWLPFCFTHSLAHSPLPPKISLSLSRTVYLSRWEWVCVPMSYIFLVIMLVLVIHLISFISLPVFVAVQCVYIQVYLIKLLFRLLLFIHSFGLLARSFVRSFPFSFLSSSSLLLLFCTSLPSGVCKYAHTYLTLLVDVLPACTLHTHLFATLLFSISFTLHRKFTSNCLDVGT